MSTPTPSPSDAMLGKIVEGRYRVVELIGSGGVCSVYRAEDRDRKTSVALKLLPNERAAQPELAARFRREAMVGKRIAHPHVAAVSESGSLDDGSLYLTMELLDGRSLAEILQKGRLPLDRALAIAKQMLSGLEGAHALGFVHRDIKPENVVVVRVGKEERVKLIDFGIAANDRAAIKLTVAGTAFGTPEYISPEMAMGVPVDARADLYSVAVVLFHMVTGRLPFAAKDLRALLRAHVDSPPPRPSAVAPEAKVPAALEQVILRALAKLPEERYESAAEMREALASVDLPRPARRRGPWMWLALIVLFGIAIAVAWETLDRGPEPKPAHSSPQPKHHAPTPRHPRQE
jgi:serine/threonine-protein kinase